MSEERDPQPTPDSTPDLDPQPAPTPAPTPSPAATKTTETPWYKARIDELTLKLHRANEERDQALNRANQPPTPATSPSINSPPVPAFDQSTFDRAVAAEAQRRSMMNEFTIRCDGCVTRGREAFGATEFDGRVRALRTLVDDKDADSSARYNGLLNAAFETGADAEIVHELGGDLDRAMRLLSMPPMKMAVELARMADNLRSNEPPTRGPAGTTNAPPPIRPVGSRGAQHTPISPDDPDRSDGLSADEWIRRRTAQVAERQKQGIIIQ